MRARCPWRCPPTPVTTRPRPWPICRPWAPTTSSRRKRPATATSRRRLPKDASPKVSLPETGCAVRHRRTDQTGSQEIRATHSDGGARVRPDQGGPRLAAVPAAGIGEGSGRMVPDLHRPQPAEAVPPLSSVGQYHTAKPADLMNLRPNTLPSTLEPNPRTGC